MWSSDCGTLLSNDLAKAQELSCIRKMELDQVSEAESPDGFSGSVGGRRGFTGGGNGTSPSPDGTKTRLDQERGDDEDRRAVAECVLPFGGELPMILALCIPLQMHVAENMCPLASDNIFDGHTMTEI